MATVDDSASKARGLLSQFENGHKLVALVAGRHVFGVTGALSCSLQLSRATVCGSMDRSCATLTGTAAQYEIRRILQ